MDEERLITSTKTVFEDQESSLRPLRLNEYIGQDQIKQNLQIFIQAAQKRGDALDHTLLYGPPGLGKTTLAHIIANEMGAQIRVTSGPAIEKSADLAAILTNLNEHDVLFIDEIHRLNKTVEEILYPAMEDYSLDIIVGKGPSARSVRIDLPKFTLIGATTKAGNLASPLRDRFGVSFRLQPYEIGALKEIIIRSAKILSCEIEDEAASAIAKVSRGIPRVANRLLKRVRDYADVFSHSAIDVELTKKALEFLEVDEKGLDNIDRAILTTIIDDFNGGPVGVDTLAAAIGEDVKTLEDVYEPYLMQIKFIARTNRGRICLKSGYEHIGRKYDDNRTLEMIDSGMTIEDLLKDE